VRVKNYLRIKDISNYKGIITLLLAFLFGTVALVLIKIVLNLGGLTNFLAVFVTATALIMYALVSYFSNQTSIEPETIGDNCYYLGFLFTLTSLSIALFQISQLDDDVTAYKELISGFGVALSSTIIGVFLRVMLMQGTNSLVASEREARLSLNKATSELRGVLALSIAEMKNFSIEISQILSETAHSIAKVAEEARDNQRSSISKETSNSLTMIEQKLSAVNNLIDSKLDDAALAVSRKIQDDMQIFANKSIQDSNSVISEIRADVQSANTNIQEFVKVLTASTNSLGGSIESAAKSAREFNLMADSSAKNLSNTLYSSINGLDQKASEIYLILQNIQKLSEKIELDQASFLKKAIIRLKGIINDR
jgi:hypothetical protein